MQKTVQLSSLKHEEKENCHGANVYPMSASHCGKTSFFFGYVNLVSVFHLRAHKKVYFISDLAVIGTIKMLEAKGN